MTSPVKIWRNQKKIRAYLRKTGEIVSWTMVHAPPSGFASQAPYAVVLVHFETGEKLIAQLVDYETPHLAIGQKVLSILRKTRESDPEGVIPYSIKVKPVNPPAA